MQFSTYRPEDYTGRGDKYLRDIANELRRRIAKKQNTFSDRNLKLNSQDLRTLSTCLVEFGEDLHNDIGIWKSLEYYNNELFGTPLPLVVNKDDLEDIILLLDSDYWFGEEIDGRFFPLFSKPNINNIFKNIWRTI